LWDNWVGRKSVDSRRCHHKSTTITRNDEREEREEEEEEEDEGHKLTVR